MKKIAVFILLLMGLLIIAGCMPKPPLAPMDVSASDGLFRDKILIEWSPSPNADGYMVYRANSENGDFDHIDTTYSTAYEDYPYDYETYYYKIQAFNDGGNSPFSQVDGGYARSIDAPTGIWATDGDYRGKIVVHWEKQTKADGYQVYRSTSATVGYNKIADIPLNSTTSYDDTDVGDGTYYYKLKAYDSYGQSDYSEYDSGYMESLPVPTNLTASDRLYRDRVELSWDSVAEADDYKVYRSTSQIGTYTLIGTASMNSYDDYPSDTSIYYYKVTSSDQYGESDFSNSDDGSRKILPAPTSLSASNGLYRDRVELSWDSVAEADEYDVYRSTSQTGTYTLIDTVSTNIYNDYPSDTNVYYYKVKSVDAYGESDDFSNSDDGSRKILPAPTNLSASDGLYTDRVEISWDSVADANEYKVYRSTTAGGVKMLIGTVSSTSYDDTGLEDTSTYHYSLKSVDAYGESDFSNMDEGYLDSAFPAVPDGLTASQGAYRDKIELSWNPLANADGYQVYRSTTVDGTYIKIGNLTGTSYDDSDYPGDTSTYYYKVNAYKSDGYSDFSSSVSGYRMELDAPTGVNASDGLYRNRVEIDWVDVPEATDYEVFRSTSAGGSYSSLGTTATNSFTDNPSDTSTYYYKVKSIDQYGESDDYSNTDAGSRKVLSAPSWVDASDGLYRDRVEISWNSVADATGYEIYSSTSPSGSYTLLDTVTSSTNYIDYPSDTITYYYKVKSTDPYGESDYSGYDEGYRKELSAPSWVNASDGVYRDRIEISWEDITDADEYKLYRATSSTGFYNLIDTVSSPSYTDYPSDMATYYYKVRSSDAYGESQLSDEDAGYRKELPAPSWLDASDDAYRDRIDIDWPGVSGASGYKVYRSEYSSSGYSLIETIYNGSTTETSDDPGDTEVYYYKVKAFDAYGDSVFSDYDAGSIEELDTPTGLTASNGTYRDRVALDWFSVSGASGYRVYRSTSSNGTYSLIDSTSYSDYDDTPPDTATYYYKVRAYDAYGESDLSVYDSGWLEELDAPTGVDATDGDYTDKIRIYWNSVADADQYKVYRASSAYGTYYLEGTTANTFYDDDSVPDRDIYYYKVKSVDSIGESPFSDYDSGYRGELPPPSGVDASDGTYSDRVNIVWNSVPDAIDYDVYRSTHASYGYSWLADTSNTYYNDYSASSGTVYYYKIRAYDGDYSDYSAYDSGYVSGGFTAYFLDFNDWTDDSINSNEEKWYYFNAISGNTYYIYWGDEPITGESYTADIQVSAYRENLSTPYFVDVDEAYYTAETLTAVATEKVYIKVEGVDASVSGTYGITVEDSPARLWAKTRGKE
jgi:fibronectin type 3 domain-containing protein